MIINKEYSVIAKDAAMKTVRFKIVAKSKSEVRKKVAIEYGNELKIKSIYE